MQLRAGTSGFSYKEWKGKFYPKELKADQYLSYYAERYPAVEINNTFYRMPRGDVLAKWAAQVPETFRFVVKAHRRITHFSRLKPASKDSLDYLLSQLARLGDKLAVLLFQLPPSFKKDIELLQSFLGYLPEDVRATFEFRHATWFDEEVYDALRAASAAWCTADDEGDVIEDLSIVPTTGWGYFRLHREHYSDDQLQLWARRIAEHASDWSEGFVFFNHDVDGPFSAEKLTRFYGDLS